MRASRRPSDRVRQRDQLLQQVLGLPRRDREIVAREVVASFLLDIDDEARMRRLLVRRRKAIAAGAKTVSAERMIRELRALATRG